VIGAANPGNYNELHDVAFLNASDGWAVGSRASGGNRIPAMDGGYTYRRGEDRPLIEHWDGRTWSVTKTPRATGILGAVSASGPNDAWAVGQESDLAMHWDGQAWRRVRPPFPPGEAVSLTDVAALSPTDAWFVGYRSQNYLRTFAAHWDGRHLVTKPTPGSADKVDFRLNSLAVVSRGDAWAVGERYFRSYDHTYTLHWDGRRWEEVPSPNALTTVPRVTGGLDYNMLQTAGADGSADVWAAGFHDRAGAGRLQLLTEHWDGSRWSLVHTPSYSGGVGIGAVAVSGPHDVWAVGSHDIGDGYVPYAMRWKGRSWVVEPPCRVGMTSGLTGVAVLPSGEVWAVGSYSFESAYRSGSEALIERLPPEAQHIRR